MNVILVLSAICGFFVISVQAIGPLGSFGVGVGAAKCEPSITTASGTYAMHKASGQYCSGDLIFEDAFDIFDTRKWQHENTLAGGGKWEFQWYTNNRSNSFCEEGFLHLRPTLTADVYGETFLSSGTVNLHGGSDADRCTNEAFYGCERTGSMPLIINPIRSAKIRTHDSFSFKYGKVEISAKMPGGDWLLPAISFLPKDNAYGAWPSSGEIDLVLSRGNRNYTNAEKHIGVEQFASSLHFGPFESLDQYQSALFVRNSKPGNGFNNDFHRYQMEWTPDKIVFSVDDVETGSIKAGAGFWSRGAYDAIAPGVMNPWRLATTNMAPFDQEFYLIMNLAVGGSQHFPDDAANSASKPWANDSPTAAADFWNARNAWLATWNLEQNLSRDASLIVDYVRVWAL
ncbi:beta-1,3-glucan-binding protein-like [Sitodiplosis mosellana]|uniref:beta-1,3-glucan-binding protein-like n=1 Tax=Sitodiplosis mosellana TaxID=263140 RepID=UPI002444165A|nr:beta-1,3-glucan-binding protein-like [Sitodiplosis mosellana]